MQIVVPAETWANERRVALIPDSVKKLTRAGLSVSVESGLGLQSGFSDADYTEAGATVSNDRIALISSGDMVLRVRKPSTEEVALLKKALSRSATLTLTTNMNWSIRLPHRV